MDYWLLLKNHDKLNYQSVNYHISPYVSHIFHRHHMLLTPSPRQETWSPSAFVGNGAESHPRRTWSKWTSAMVQKCWELSWLFQWKIPYNWRWSIEIYWYGYAKKVLSKTQQWHDYTYSWLNQRCFICICMYTYIYIHILCLMYYIIDLFTHRLMQATMIWTYDVHGGLIICSWVVDQEVKCV
jgi:hypothetical protein